MNKFEQLQQKIKEKGGFKTEINSFVESIEKKAEEKIAKSSNKTLVENVDKLISEVRNLLADNDNGINELLNYLERKDIEVEEKDNEENKNFKEVIEGIYNLAKQFDKVQKVLSSNSSKELTQEDIRKVFDTSLQAIEKILVSQNEIPSKTIVSKANGHVSRVYEEYNKYSLTYSYTWDTNGGFSEKVVKKLL